MATVDRIMDHTRREGRSTPGAGRHRGQEALAEVIVIRPLRLVSDAADLASKGEATPAPLPVRGKDEIATMTASFNRMQVSLAKALKLLR